MKTIKIAVLTKNKRYGQALARGIAEETSGIEVICTANEPESDYDILVTDFKDLSEPQILVLSDKNTCDDNLPDKRLPVSKILDKILEKYIQISGKNFITQRSKHLAIIGVGGNTGGAGTTASAIVMGRILALSKEKPVIYINCSPKDDYVEYIDETFDHLKTIKEFIYRITAKQTILLSNYMQEDFSGLRIMKPGELIQRNNLELILKYLDEKSEVEYVVIDAGREKEFFDLCHKTIIINNCKDSRRKEAEEIYNFSLFSGVNNIREDRESFISKGEKVQISMEGTFAEDIKNIIDMILVD